MMMQHLAEQPRAAAIRRPHARSPLDDRARAALDAALARPRRFRAKREIIAEGQEITAPLLILDGWAARQLSFGGGAFAHVAAESDEGLVARAFR